MSLAISQSGSSLNISQDAAEAAIHNIGLDVANDVVTVTVDDGNPQQFTGVSALSAIVIGDLPNERGAVLSVQGTTGKPLSLSFDFARNSGQAFVGLDTSSDLTVSPSSAGGNSFAVNPNLLPGGSLTYSGSVTGTTRFADNATVGVTGAGADNVTIERNDTSPTPPPGDKAASFGCFVSGSGSAPVRITVNGATYGGDSITVLASKNLSDVAGTIDFGPGATVHADQRVAKTPY